MRRIMRNLGVLAPAFRFSAGRWRSFLAACVLTLAVPLVPSASAATESADYAKAYSLGLEAYTYGLPLLATNKTFLTMSSINVSNGTGFGPVNQFNHVRQLNSPTSKAVVAPGSNALSSIAWLDLTKGPQVLHVPLVQQHFFVLALLDPYTEDVRNLGTVHATAPGDYVIVGPGQQTVKAQARVQRIDVHYTRIWIIGSTQLKGTSDLAAVHQIQDGYTLTPLSAYGTNYHPTQLAHPNTTVENYALPSGLAFFDQLGQLLKLFPPPAADKAELSKLAAVGIGPGMTPSQNPRLTSDTLRGLQDAMTAGPAQIRKDAASLYMAGFATHNGYLLGGFGHYGTNYQLRAVIAQVGLGAVTSDLSIFALSLTDHTGKPLSGSTSYDLHLRELPPVTEGWTLTVYDLHGFLVPNALHRYQLSNASALARNPDGSVDIYLQSSQPKVPAQASNWLPTPSGAGFEVIWRLLGPQPAQINGILDGHGWQPPAITALK